MTISKREYDYYLNVVKNELVSATGCTEPVAIAYATAKAVEVLNDIPDAITIEASQGIIKNAKSVIVPNTNGMRGIKAAVSAGAIAGNPKRELDVIADISDKDLIRIVELYNSNKISVKPFETAYLFDLQVTVKSKANYAKIRVINHHTNIVLIEKNRQTLFSKPYMEKTNQAQCTMSIESIVAFANTVNLDEIKHHLQTQIDNNTAIANEGLKHSYGANIGSILMKSYGNDIKNRAKAIAAAASDARMAGCKLPVTIVAGSGNQGLTASLPVIEYAKELNASQEELYRALIVANLVTVRLKIDVGSLSAFCGAVFAGAGCGAGIAYLHGRDYSTIAHTIVNALAIISGMVCDGAKASCAAKIAASVDAGILGYEMHVNGQEFLGGDGIITKGIENTIRNVARLAKDGMRETEREIVKIMTEEC